MHICIVGDGASGWLAYHSLKHLENVKKITIIGSPVIPKIGVGESTTTIFDTFIKTKLKLSSEEFEKFLIDIDAAIKYGVSYEGWSDKTFLHHFRGRHQIRSKVFKFKHDPRFTKLIEQGYMPYPISQFDEQCHTFLLGKKSKKDHHHHFSVPLAKEIYQNNIYLDDIIQKYTYHFDAGKFIQTLHKLAIKDEKLVHIRDTVVDLEYVDGLAKMAVTESGRKIEADYFISCIGQTAFNQKVFREKYISYNDILLTNKALFYPLHYKDNKKEFHPFTKARTMPNGWRWITPTLSRIGTGYVFSENHITVDKAVEQLQEDIGDNTIQPFVVDFHPRRVNEVFKKNTCTLGMASGFQEPLDAPGLSSALNFIEMLEILLLPNFNNCDVYANKLAEANIICVDIYNYWTSFILHQYKTCNRIDTPFWKDHKNVKFDLYEEIVEEIFNPKEIIYDKLEKKYYTYYSKKIFEPWLFYNTTSGKDIQWDTKEVNEPLIPYKMPKLDPRKIINHRDYFDAIMAKHNLST